MENTTNQILLTSYIEFARFICDSMGSSCGTVVYRVDESETDGEVIAVFGRDTHRKPGDRMTIFLREVSRTLRDSGEAGLTHVDTEASTSDGRVKLNIFAIRSPQHRMIGLFILCTEIELFYSLRDAVNNYLGYQSPVDTSMKAVRPAESGTEGAVALSEYIQQIIRDEIEAFSVPVERMTMEEKRQVVQRLEQLEVFYVKDSVKTAASLLGVSVPTVYRLLKREAKKD